ncbi:hypothetical protein [Paraburkholderia sp. DGU8]|uniref:hypothetical protein n=1 Tax=Paraburkholderia sp. DGU8 TaxID=3161997 RepID=UPI0034662D0B
MREWAASVADAIVDGMERNALQVIREGETRPDMVALNRDNPTARDQLFPNLKQIHSPKQ